MNVQQFATAVGQRHHGLAVAFDTDGVDEALLPEAANIRIPRIRSRSLVPQVARVDNAERADRPEDPRLGSAEAVGLVANEHGLAVLASWQRELATEDVTGVATTSLDGTFRLAGTPAAV